MGIEIKLDMQRLKAIEDAVVRATAKTIDALHGDVVASQRMPFDTGDMQNNQTFTDMQQQDGEIRATLITGSPQARRLYYHPEYNFQTVNNPNAGGAWLEPWLTGDQKDFAKNTFAENLKKEAGL